MNYAKRTKLWLIVCLYTAIIGAVFWCNYANILFAFLYSISIIVCWLLGQIQIMKEWKEHLSKLAEDQQ